MLVAVMMMSGLMMAQKPCHKGETCEGAAQCRKVQHKPISAQEMALNKAKMLRVKLELDKKQYNEVYKIYDKYLTDKLAEKNEKQASVTTTSEQPKLMKKQDKALEKQMKKILTDVQYAEWKVIESKSHVHYRGRMEGNRMQHRAKRPEMKTITAE